jgi:hypothetical protein
MTDIDLELARKRSPERWLLVTSYTFYVEFFSLNLFRFISELV